MIFVTVGTHEQPFNRLIQKIDELKKDGIINEDVIIQTGFSTYEPKYCQWSKLIPYQQMVKNVADAAHCKLRVVFAGISWLTLMQHYGLPTRLLDWSESPLVALYFALSSDEDAKADAAVWVLNPMKLNKKVGYAGSCQCHEPSCLIPICTKNSPSPCGNGEHKSYIIFSVCLTECTSQLNRWFSGGLRLTQTQPYIIPV